ncbi:replication protein A 70 kDa DNA-binding subunit-like isoform X2 [Syngnathus acus]|uniref:replication protein A 70 kDa DNA-binding subunit-like isoform X2 n=1 Tax=Syngnathus acus TaxID=161584 RepID=UPI0018863D62|nr:replication protein A 70 kDa DNA-binding subunit-like isoform X2 [Syngnathus acus]
MSVKLTQGAIEALFNESVVQSPILQVINIREYPAGKQGLNRYRLNLSDGERSLSCFLLATHLNHLRESQLLEPNCVCVLKKTIFSQLSSRHVVVVLDMDVLQTAAETGGRIGNPTQLTDQTPDQQQAEPSTSRSDEIPGPSGCGPSGGGNYDMKTSPRKAPAPRMASPMQASPMKAHGMASPRMASPMKTPGMASPMQASPMKAPGMASPRMPSPMKAPGMASPMQASPMKAPGMASPRMPSPMKAPGMASPMQASPMKAPGMASPMQASPMKAHGMASPRMASLMTPSPMKWSGMASPSSSPSQSPTRMTPIYQLNPYLSNWTIRARVINKTDIRNWSNSRREGKVFNLEVVDETGEIKITAFNEEVDKFFSLVEQDKVYLISKGTVKLANKQFTSLKNDYEITLSASSRIVPCDDDRGVPNLLCRFVPISQLEDKDPDAVVDVIGVCEEAEDVSLITTKAGKPLSKRALMLTDSSGKMVTLTLWGDEAQKFNASCHPVVAVRGARVSTFGGRSLTALLNSTLIVNPDIPEAFALRDWYNQVGYALCSQSLTEVYSASGDFRTNWKTLRDVKTEQLGHGEKADYFNCVATVVFCRKENCLYRACPDGSCYKKVHEQDDGRYRCDKCGKDYPNFNYRFMLSVNLADFGDNMWATCFQETAETLLGISAEQLGHLKDTDENAFDNVFDKIYFSTHVFRNRVKLENFNDECRVKVTVMDVLPADQRQHSRRLLSAIRELASRAPAPLIDIDA